MSEDSNVAAPDGDTIRPGRRAQTFVMTPEWIVLAGLSPQALALYTLLLAHVNRTRDDTLVWPVMETLAELLGFKKRQSVNPYLAELAALGAIDIERVRNFKGHRRNIYTVHELAPDGYTGELSLKAFYKARKARLDAMSLTADLGMSAVADQAMYGTADMNYTNATRRSERDESSHSRGGSTSSPERDTPVGARSQARRASDTPTATRPIDLDAPEEYYDTEEWSDGQAHRWLVSASVAAMRKAGKPLPTGTRDRVGAAVKSATERGLGRMQIIGQLVDHLNRAAAGDPTLTWMVDPANVRPPRPNFDDLMRQLNPDEPEEALIEHLHEEVDHWGTDATVYSMGETHHFNAIVNTVRARDAS